MALADLSAAGGPIDRIAEAVPAGTPAWNSPEAEALRREVQLLGCLVRANTRDAVADLRNRVRALHPDPPPVRLADLDGAVERLCSDLQAVLIKLREARPAFMKARRPRWLGELFEYADEYVSVAVEEQLTALLAALAKTRPDVTAARTRLAGLITAEQDHRKAAGYATVMNGPAARRRYVYRASALKKFMSSVLFLEVRKGQEGRRIKQGVAGVAAATAMLFATIAAIASQQYFALNSMPFVVALVIAYVFKDRIKEWLKVYLSSRMTRHLSDFRSSIVGPGGIKVGRCRETFGFVDVDGVAPEVMAARHADANSQIEPATKPEVLIRYIKDIVIRGKRTEALGDGFRELNDIIRFNVTSFLARMDDPVRRVAMYDRTTGKVADLDCPKQYHLNMVLLFRGPNGTSAVRRFRIILDRAGIVGLNDVTLPPGARVVAVNKATAPVSAPRLAAARRGDG